MTPFEDGARVCFVGDSFIAQNDIVPWIAKTYIEQFPDRDVRFFACGAAGGSYEFALKILESDILPFRPTHIVVCFGINDSYRWVLGNNQVPKTDIYNCLKRQFEIFKGCLEKFCQKIIDSGIELIVCTPAPYDEYAPCSEPALKGGYALMSEYANAVRTIAKNKNYTLCDYYEKLVELMQTETIFSADRVHPNPHGYYRIAEILLNSQGIKIGEEKGLSEFSPALRKLMHTYSQLLTCECMVLHLPEGTEEDEKIKAAKSYTGNDKWFISLCKEYIENRPKTSEIRKNIEEIYETIYKKEKDNDARKD